MIKDILSLDHPVAVYESKHRILKLMEELDLFSAAAKIKLEVMLGRELTKMFETCYFGSPAELALRLKSDADMGKGEFVVLIRKIKK